MMYGFCLQKYLDSAEADKQNYEREMSAYKKTEAYKSMNKRKKKNNAHVNQQSGPLDMNISGATGNSSFGHNTGSSAMNMMNRPTHMNHETGMEIPIFTEEFLDHNKGSFSFRPLTSENKRQRVSFILFTWNTQTLYFQLFRYFHRLPKLMRFFFAMLHF